MPIQAFKTNIEKKGRVIINAENMKKYVALWDSAFPFSCEGHLNTGTVFFCSDVKGQRIKTKYDNKKYGCLRRRVFHKEQ